MIDEMQFAPPHFVKAEGSVLEFVGRPRDKGKKHVKNAGYIGIAFFFLVVAWSFTLQKDQMGVVLATMAMISPFYFIFLALNSERTPDDYQYLTIDIGNNLVSYKHNIRSFKAEWERPFY